MRSRILLVHDADHFPRDIVSEITRMQVEVIPVSAGIDVLPCIESRHPDFVVMHASEETAPCIFELARRVREHYNRLPMVFIAKDGSEDLAIAALRAGFSDYIKPPLSGAGLTGALERFISNSALSDAPHKKISKAEEVSFASVPQMLGESPVMCQIRSDLHRISIADSNVLVTGETGTGKELVAELLHTFSMRRKKPLVRINCAAVPDGLFESELFGYERGAFTGAYASKAGKLALADGGSVFLDEIGDLSLYSQAKILRVLENKEIERLGGTKIVPLDVRVIAATNRDLEHLVSTGNFRGDLFFRLDVVRVHLPPLRERKEDIPLLIDYYIRKLNSKFGSDVEGLREETLDLLLRYDWPGNIRELKNLLESVFVTASERRIALADLPSRFRERLKLVEDRSQDDREKLLLALLSTDWNKSRAAEKLKWSRMTLYRKMAKFGVDEGRGKHRPQLSAAAVKNS